MTDEITLRFDLALPIETFSVSAQFELGSCLTKHRPFESEMEAYGRLFPKRRLIPEIVSEVLVDYPSVTVKMIYSMDRHGEVARARQHIWHQIKEERPDISLSEIGRRFDRNHQTIIHGIRQHANRLLRGKK